MTFSCSENIQLLSYNADLSIFKVVCQLAIFNPLPNVQMKHIIFFSATVKQSVEINPK